MAEYIFLILLVIVSLYFIVTEFIDCKERFQNYLGVATKCFSCEKQFPPGQEWRGQPSKCFDCEKELAQRHGPCAAFGGKQQKCFSCS